MLLLKDRFSRLKIRIDKQRYDFQITKTYLKLSKFIIMLQNSWLLFQMLIQLQYLMTVINIMLTIHSPKFSASSKAELLSNKMSPSFRSKRIPSALDNYSCQNNQVRNSKNQSPSKFSQECIRRKSQLCENNPNIANNGKKSKEKNPQNIIDSIQYLKEEYKILKQAYKDLIQQKIKNTEEITKYKAQILKIKTEYQKLCKENQKLKMQSLFLEQENQRIKRQCYKMLEVQKFKAKKLEESLTEKEEYINQTLFKIRTQGDESYMNTKKAMSQSGLFTGGDIPTVQEQSLTISQDKSAQFQKDKVANNQSQFLSFSLTSILEQSTYKNSAVSQKRQHTKVVSELNLPIHDSDIKVTQVKSAKNKDIPCPFKKNKKDGITSKLDITTERQIKTHQLITISNLTNPRSLLAIEKKGSKNKATKSFRRKQQQKDNSELKNHKKKSKKTINISSND